MAYLTGGGGPHDEPQSSVNDISGCKLLVLEVLLLELFQQMFDGYDINSRECFGERAKLGLLIGLLEKKIMNCFSFSNS